MPRRPAHILAMALCAALVVASCSDDGDEPAATTTTATSAPTASEPAEGPPSSESSTTTRAPLDPAESEAMEQAQALNLTIDDFPSGWQNLPPAEGEIGVVEVCSTVDLDAHRVAQARSDAFSYSIEPGTLQASTAVTILDDEAAATALIADFRTDSFVQCATEQLSRDTDTYSIDGALSRNDSAPDLADEAVALSGDFVVTPADDSPDHTLGAIVVAVRRGDTVVTFSTSAIDRGLDEETVRSLLTTIDERLAG